MSRLFFGVEIPQPVKQHLADVRTALQERGVIAQNWSDPDLYHITVLFLGELAADAVPTLARCARSSAGVFPPFTLALGEIGTFPKSKVLWVGLQHTDGMRTLEWLHQHLSAEVGKTGLVQLESRPYRAHLTLARKLDVASVPEGVERGSSLHHAVVGRSFEVAHLTLFESKRVAGKLVYPAVEKYPLMGEVGVRS